MLLDRGDRGGEFVFQLLAVAAGAGLLRGQRGLDPLHAVAQGLEVCEDLDGGLGLHARGAHLGDQRDSHFRDGLGGVFGGALGGGNCGGVRGLGGDTVGGGALGGGARGGGGLGGGLTGHFGPSVRLRFFFRHAARNTHGSMEESTESAIARAARLPVDVREVLLGWCDAFERARVEEYYRVQLLRRYGRTPSSAKLGAQVARGPLGDVGAPFWPELSRFEAEHRCTTLDCSFSHFTLDCLRCRRAPREGYVRLLERMLNPSGANNLL